MRRSSVWGGALGAVALAGLLVPAGASAMASSQHASAPTAVTGSCPRGILPLPANGVQSAADTALANAARLYPGLNTRGAEVMAADRSSFAGVLGHEVSSMCGKKAAGSTVVVQVLFPRMLPSASLSESVVFVGKFAHGYPSGSSRTKEDACWPMLAAKLPAGAGRGA